jgi:ATP-binding cassette subfamily B protein
MQNLRKFTVDKLLALPLPFFEQVHSGDIMTRVNSDLEAIGSIYSWSFFRFLLAVFYGLGSAFIMMFLSWQLAVLIIILAVAETWIIAKASLRIRENSKYIQEKTGLSNEMFLDIVKGIRFIRMFSIEHILNKKYRKVNEEVSAFTIQRNQRILLMNAISDLFNAVNLVGILSIGIVMYFMNYIDLGSVMAFLILQDGVSYMFYNLGEFFPSIQQALASVQRVFDILDEESETDYHDESKIKHDPEGKNESIICKNLSFKYPNQHTPAIDDITCEIPGYKITTIIGPSGSGKSTLVKLLLGFYKPGKGKVIIENLKYANLGLEHIRNHYSYVPQSVYLFCDTGRTVEEILDDAARCGPAAANETAVRQMLEDWIEARIMICVDDRYLSLALRPGNAEDATGALHAEPQNL